MPNGPGITWTFFLQAFQVGTIFGASTLPNNLEDSQVFHNVLNPSSQHRRPGFPQHLENLENLEKITVTFPVMEIKNFEKYHGKMRGYLEK